MDARKLEFELTKTVETENGSVTVTVQSNQPIDPNDFMILRPDALTNMAECLASLGEAMSPPEKK